MKNVIIISALLFLPGCVTTKGPSEVAQLQMKVVQLERKMEEKDNQIQELKFTVDDLSQQVDHSVDQQPIVEAKSTPGKDSAALSASKKDDSQKGTIRVAVDNKDVQLCLKNAGYYTGIIDGKIGEKTVEAIKKFQQDHSLTADGLVGEKTWLELKRYLNQGM